MFAACGGVGRKGTDGRDVGGVGQLKMAASPGFLPNLLFLLFTLWIAVFYPPELSVHINTALTVSHGRGAGGGVCVRVCVRKPTHALAHKDDLKAKLLCVWRSFPVKSSPLPDKQRLV